VEYLDQIKKDRALVPYLARII